MKVSSGLKVVPLDRCEVECVDPEWVAAVLDRMPGEAGESSAPTHTLYGVDDE